MADAIVFKYGRMGVRDLDFRIFRTPANIADTPAVTNTIASLRFSTKYLYYGVSTICSYYRYCRVQAGQFVARTRGFLGMLVVF